VLRPGEWAAGEADPVMFSPLGEEGEQVVRLPCHTTAVSCTFNLSTVESAFASNNACPTCGTRYPLPGPQPTGTMLAFVDTGFDCAGHGGMGTIVIHYDFPSGTQGPQHPQPDARYKGTQRACMLPNDATGVACLGLLRTAFLRGALFRIGTSSTSGADNVVVWSIHQKTAPDGGPTRHGWPDPEYLQRLQSECAAVGIADALTGPPPSADA